MTGLTPQLRDAAFRWIADDPDEGDRAELQRILANAMARDEQAAAELADRLGSSLTFGTAGLRGAVRAGSNGMNSATVRRATAGLAAHLVAHGHVGATVVVGRDARHRSDRFADDAAGVLAAAGFDVRVLPGPLPTPVLAHATRAMGAAAGVQITASHNPPADNGYKVYLDGGAQLVPPADAEIEAAIAAQPGAVQIPVASTWTVLPDDVVDAYVERAAARPRGTARELRVAVTAMHGVGAATLRAVLERARFTDVHEVADQRDPDPDFPTVAFPNPEEPGAADRLLALAADVGADLAIALDPDADRCALGVRDPAHGGDAGDGASDGTGGGAHGGWRMLSGDETGALLGAHVLATLDPATAPDPLVATTIVSSSLLGEIARAAGARYEETLTGFKWIVRAGDAGEGLVFGYEEALGLAVDPDAVRDKDGISAAALACDLAATLRAQGRTLLDRLDELAVAHGVHVTRPVTVRLAEPGSAAMARVRRAVPTELAGHAVTAEDLLPRTDGLRLTGDGVRVVIRPSGTEPKLKAYLQVVEPVADAAALPAAKEAAARRMAELHAAVEALLS